MYIIKIKIPQKGDKHKNECILPKTQLNQHMVHGIQNNSLHGHGENRSTLNRYPWPPWDPDLFSKVSNLWSDGATTRIFLTFVNLLLAGNKECYTIMRIIYTRENSELDDPWMTFVYFLLCYGLSLFVNFCFYDNSTGVKKRGSNDLSRRVLTKLCCELQSIRWHM